MTTNYKQLFAIQKRLEEQVKKACPSMAHRAGIYFYTREDEDGKHCYIGQSIDCLKRSCSHLQGYQRIDLSLRKRGFYSEQNQSGWQLNVLYFPENALDEKEQYFINKYRCAGWEVYNIESGGSIGKTMINDRKPARGYRDGLKQGEKNLRRKLRDLIDKYLTISTKKDGKLAQNALEKFNALLTESKEQEN